MIGVRLVRCLLALSAGVCLLPLPPVQAQTAPSHQAAPPSYKPEIGQAGKDVVWVPTPQPVVNAMLELARVTAQDYVIDLGSGDGPIVIAAARRGARALGIEFNAEMVALSKRNAAAAGVSDRAAFRQGDIFETDFSQATVVTMFLLPQLNLRLRPKLLDLAPGTRIVSNSFTMDDWLPDETQQVGNGCETWCLALFWIVPAKVDGTWTSPQGTVKLEQTFQFVRGTFTTPRGVLSIQNGKLRGPELTFTVDGARYTARVAGDSMTGTAETVDGKSAPWTATRAKTP
jgi:hypothetical protein